MHPTINNGGGGDIIVLLSSLSVHLVCPVLYEKSFHGYYGSRWGHLRHTDTLLVFVLKMSGYHVSFYMYSSTLKITFHGSKHLEMQGFHNYAVGRDLSLL